MNQNLIHPSTVLDKGPGFDPIKKHVEEIERYQGSIPEKLEFIPQEELPKLLKKMDHGSQAI